MPFATKEYSVGGNHHSASSGILFRGMYAFVVCIFFVSNIVYSGNFSEAYTCEKSSSLIITSSEEALLITTGSITAQEGYSVRLLPGTRIKSTESFVVTIASQDNYEKLMAKAEKRGNNEKIISIMHRKPITDSFYNFALIINGFSNRGRNPLLIQKLNHAFLPVRTQQTPVALGNSLLTETIIQPIIRPGSHTYQTGYQPVMSWGKRAENIRVMLS